MRRIDFEPIWNESFPGVKPIIEELRNSHEGSKTEGSTNDSSQYLYWNKGGLRYGLGAILLRENSMVIHIGIT